MNRSCTRSSITAGLVLTLLAAVGVACGGCNKKHAADQQFRAGSESVAQAAKGEPAAEKAARMIIYTATLRITVEDFGKAEQQLTELLASHKAYVVQSELSGAPGSPRSGHWKVRVPVEQFDAFRTAAAKLGELERSNVDSQDVTEEFFDLKARIKNREADEESLRKLYEKTDGKMESILAVRRELQNIRLEIEREQGRLNLLQKLTEMTAVTVYLNERGAFVPAESASFGTRLGRTFSDSLAGLLGLGQWFVLLVVALAPWLPPIMLCGAGLWLLRRRIKAAIQGAAASPTPAPPRSGDGSAMLSG